MVYAPKQDALDGIEKAINLAQAHNVPVALIAHQNPADAAAETLRVAVEVLSDASGTISLSNEAGNVDAKTLHNTLMTLLRSNWAAVATFKFWGDALTDFSALQKSNLVASAKG